MRDMPKPVGQQIANDAADTIEAILEIHHYITVDIGKGERTHDRWRNGCSFSRHQKGVIRPSPGLRDELSMRSTSIVEGGDTLYKPPEHLV